MFAPWFIHDRVAGEDIEQFYTVDQETRIGIHDHGGLFDFLVNGHIFPEIYVVRTSLAREVTIGANSFAFFYFVHIAALVDRAAVTFSPEPFYRSVTRYFEDDVRTQTGIEEVKFAYFKHRDEGGTLEPGDFAGFLQNGNTLLSRCFDDKFGRIEPGYKADLTVFDYPSPTPFEEANLAGHLLFGIGSKDVNGVMVNGSFIYRDGAFGEAVDAKYREAKKAAAALWKRFDTFT